MEYFEIDNFLKFIILITARASWNVGRIMYYLYSRENYAKFKETLGFPETRYTRNYVRFVISVAILQCFVGLPTLVYIDWYVVKNCIRHLFRLLNSHILFRKTNESHTYQGVEYDLINCAVFSLCSAFYDSAILFAYFLENVRYARYWRARRGSESEKYGLNQREHEIIIHFTRYIVVFSSSLIFDILVGVFSALYIEYPNKVFYTIWGIVWTMNNVSYCATLYLSQEYGHSTYKKCCARLDKRCKNYLTSWYQSGSAPISRSRTASIEESEMFDYVALNS